MAKPKTKGDPIQVRLPLDTDAAVRARALQQQTSPAAVVEGIVTNTCRKVAPIGPTAGDRLHVTAKAADILASDPPCPHPKRTVTVHPSGTALCECGAIRGVQGEWR